MRFPIGKYLVKTIDHERNRLLEFEESESVEKTKKFDNRNPIPPG